MSLQLYRLPAGVEPTLGPTSHAGLWFDKFYDFTADPAGRLGWLKTFTRAGVTADVEAFAHRVLDLTMARGGAVAEVSARSRFVTGLGRSHPVENGFAWHPTLGTPYLPGSSLKGLTRAQAIDLDPDEVARVLGDQARSGSVAFLDAVPLGAVTMGVDILTPHYANWTEERPPGDWRSPVPVPFLVAEKGWSMLCAVVPLRPDDQGRHDADLALGWLVTALDNLGAGAKTAVGYGHFMRVDPRDSIVARWRAEAAQRAEAATPEGRWRQRLKGRNENEVLDLVRRHLEATPLEAESERRGFVAAVLATGLVDRWRRGEKSDSSTVTGTKKLRERAKLVDDEAAALGLAEGDSR